MGRQVSRLTAVKVNALKKKGLYPDGGGLYLQVSGNGAKSWIFRYKASGRARDMGLGPLSAISLAAARDLAAVYRRQRLAGLDPIEVRKDQRAQQKLDAAKATTFDQASEAYIAAHSGGWRNPKHRSQWTNTLQTYASPVIGGISVQSVDTDLVLKVLEPIWQSKTETASRVRGRIEAILDWAKARGMRTGENPARWRGHLQNLLPKRSRVQQVRHHPALPYTEIPDFLALVTQREDIASSALVFSVLTAARTGEVLGARWDEIDMKAAVWTVPASRMKGAREHRVPLSSEALAVLSKLARERINEFVFPGLKRGRPLSNMSLLMLLRNLKRSDITVHGFRSTFRDWAAERTNFPREIAEAALAHAVKDKVEAAYQRGDLLEKRREVMSAWAQHCIPRHAKSRLNRRVNGQKMGRGKDSASARH